MQTESPQPNHEAEPALTNDPVFQQEQQHLAVTYAKLQELGRALVRRMEKTREAAAQDKRSMSEELAPNFATYADAMETYADFAAMNRVIDAYNLAQDADAEQLERIQLLLKQPYFAKVALQFKPGQEPKELYIGTAGISDESYRRLVVDWRSPVAEVYYNQDNGPTSYAADGRTIDVDLKLRRQFDIEEDRLNAYFDTTVAIQDSLLLASLSKRRTAQMQAITATIQKEQNQVVRHEDVPVLLVSGIAGSGKTSVLLQRIAYLFYQNRGSLDASEVFLVSPNPVFQHYIASVLPDLGERNPESLTWDEFARGLLPPDRGVGEADVPLAALERIDAAVAGFEFDGFDFRDIRVGDVRLISADSVRKLADKLRRIPAGPHRVTLMREELHTRLEARLAQMAGTDETLDELSALDLDEQLRIFHEAIAPADEQEANQAIAPGTATFDEVRAVFEAAHGPVEECRLMTSYRSTPEITELFASLLDDEERASISSIQRADTSPTILPCPDEASYAAALREAVDAACAGDGLAAVIVPWKHEAKRIQKLLGDNAPTLVDDTATLPASGVVLITLKLAKGLEFDRVIVPDASARIFPAGDPLARRRLYTTLSRATRELTVLARGELTPLLKD